MSNIEIITFGCRLNAYESEVMREHAGAAGLGPTVIVNTCAVTQESVRQARQAIRRARRDNPQARIVVTGCAAQIEPARFADMAEVDHVIGNGEKTDRATFLAFGSGDSERVKVNDIMSVTETAGHLIDGFGAQARAYVQVQNGCDHRCTFCIIPYGRGPSRSVPAGEVVAQVRKLVANGYAEIVLTGVDITAYGADLPGELTLGKLVTKILALVPELKRLRLSSIDSIEADPALLKAIAEEERLMPHLHLSLQAGDDLTLKRMKRRHSRAHAVEFCAEVRKLRPDIVFGADLIAGFPTESDAMFENSLSLIDECGLTFLHVFPFSARPGTPAARMRQVNGAVVAARAASLREKGVAALQRHLVNAKGRHIQVLMEREGRGRAGDFTPVRIDAGERPAKVIEAVVHDHDGGALIARMVA
jgi:threonylcarbamoyladenosine tRNA methylthiotransferase MtaB